MVGSVEVAEAGRDLVSRVEQALWRLEPIRTVGNLINIEAAPGGVVTVQGPVRTRIIKDDILQTVRRIEGVKQVVDLVVPDPDLEIAVTKALAADEQTKSLPPGKLAIRSHDGTITIIGRVPLEVDRDAILNVVRDVPNVRGVVDKISL